MASTRIRNFDDYSKAIADAHASGQSAGSRTQSVPTVETNKPQTPIAQAQPQPTSNFNVNVTKTPHTGFVSGTNYQLEGQQPSPVASRAQPVPTVETTKPQTPIVQPTSQEEEKDPYAQVINGPSAPKTDPTYEYLRGVSRQDLLDANVMTQIANEIARKNMQGDLQAMGLANSGYAGTAAALRENATQGQLMANQRAYNEAMRNIDYQERTAQQGTLAAQADEITSSLANIAEGSRDAFLQQNGLVKDESGRWVNGENTNYSDVMLNGINNAYFAANNPNVEGQSNQTVAWLASAMTSLSVADRQREMRELGLVYDSKNNKWTAGKDCKLSDSEIETLNLAWKDAGYGDQINVGTYAGVGFSKGDLNGMLSKVSVANGSPSDISYEINELVNRYKDKDPEEGHLVWLENGKDSSKYAVLRWQNGQWVQVSNPDGINKSQCELFKGEEKPNVTKDLGFEKADKQAELTNALTSGKFFTKVETKEINGQKVTVRTGNDGKKYIYYNGTWYEYKE